MKSYSIKLLEKELEALEKRKDYVPAEDSDPQDEELNDYRIKDLKDNIRILKQLTEC